MTSEYEKARLQELLNGGGMLTVGSVMKMKKQAKEEANAEFARRVYWASPVGEFDDFGDRIKDTIIDAPTRQGPWALMTQNSWNVHARSMRLGTGMGQRYAKQADGKWLKVEG